jgi:hypothetical protein
MQLLHAAEKGDIDAIIEALAAGAEIECRQMSLIGGARIKEDEFEPPCDADTQEVVEFKDGAISSVNGDWEEATKIERGEKLPGLSPLMSAAKGGKAMAVALLLDARASPYSRDEVGRQPIHFAASVGCRESCRYLLSARANPAALDEAQRDAYACLPHYCIAGSADRMEWGTLLEVFAAPSHSSNTRDLDSEVVPL